MVAYGTYEIASALSQNDVIEFCKLPKGAIVVGGWLYGDDIDTGTEAFELDIGTAADPDMLLNSGVISGDVVAEMKAVASISQPLQGLLASDGPQEMTAETTIIGTVVAAANAGGTGTLSLVVHYTMKMTVG
jgi:hypothetical protein